MLSSPNSLFVYAAETFFPFYFISSLPDPWTCGSYPPSPLFLVHKLDSNQCPSAARQVLRVCITQGGAPSPKTYRAVGLPVAASCPPRLVPYLALLSRSRARRRQGVTRPAPCRSSRCCRGAPPSRASARPRFRLLPCPGRTYAHANARQKELQKMFLKVISMAVCLFVLAAGLTYLYNSIGIDRAGT